MDDDGDDVLFDVRVKFRLAIDVPLAQTDAKITRSVSVFFFESFSIFKIKKINKMLL